MKKSLTFQMNKELNKNVPSRLPEKNETVIFLAIINVSWFVILLHALIKIFSIVDSIVKRRSWEICDLFNL